MLWLIRTYNSWILETKRNFVGRLHFSIKIRGKKVFKTAAWNLTLHMKLRIKMELVLRTLPYPEWQFPNRLMMMIIIIIDSYYYYYYKENSVYFFSNVNESLAADCPQRGPSWPVVHAVFTARLPCFDSQYFTAIA